MAHDNIVKLHEYTENDKEFVLFMEYCNDANYFEEKLVNVSLKIIKHELALHLRSFRPPLTFSKATQLSFAVLRDITRFDIIIEHFQIVVRRHSDIKLSATTLKFSLIMPTAISFQNLSLIFIRFRD